MPKVYSPVGVSCRLSKKVGCAPTAGLKAATRRISRIAKLIRRNVVSIAIDTFTIEILIGRSENATETRFFFRTLVDDDDKRLVRNRTAIRFAAPLKLLRDLSPEFQPLAITGHHFCHEQVECFERLLVARLIRDQLTSVGRHDLFRPGSPNPAVHPAGSRVSGIDPSILTKNEAEHRCVFLRVVQFGLQIEVGMATRAPMLFNQLTANLREALLILFVFSDKASQFFDLLICSVVATKRSGRRGNGLRVDS